MKVDIVTTFEDAMQEQTMTLRRQAVSEVCESMIQAMKNGLPSEAQTMDTFDYILRECREMIHKRKISLE